MWEVCVEETKGRNPRLVFYTDKNSRERNAIICVKWYAEGWYERPKDRERTPRPPFWKRVIYRYENESAPWGHRGRMSKEVIDQVPPQEDILHPEEYGIPASRQGGPDLLALERADQAVEPESGELQPVEIPSASRFAVDPVAGELPVPGGTVLFGADRVSGKPVEITIPERAERKRP